MNPEILDRFPAGSYEEAEQLGRGLVSGGPTTVRRLVEILGDEEANRLANIPMRAPWHL